MRTDDLAARAVELTRYARTRIAECRAVEGKFTAAQADADQLAASRRKGIATSRDDQRPPPQAVVEAWTERQTWQRVLEMLGAKVSDDAR